MPNRLLRISQVLDRTGQSRSTLYTRIKEGTFPKQVDLGPRSVRWVEAEVEDWISRRIANSRNACEAH
jgi:prophage regulatory protein